MKNEITPTISSNGKFPRATELGKILSYAGLLVLGIMLFCAAGLPAAETQPLTGLTGNAASDQTLPVTAQQQESASLLFAILKVIGSLSLVLGIMLLVFMLIKKLGLTGQALRSGSLINIIETRALAPKKFVAVIEIAKQYMVIGITDQQINLIARLDNNDSLDNLQRPADRTESAFADSPFKALIQKAILAAGGKNKKDTPTEQP